MNPAKSAKLIEMPFGLVTRAKGTVYYIGVQITKRKAIMGVVWLIEKHYESVLRCVRQKKSIMASMQLLQPTALLPTDQYHVNELSLINNPPPVMWPVVCQSS